MFSHSRYALVTNWWLEEIPLPSEYPITAYEPSSEKAGASQYQRQDPTKNNYWPHSRLATAILWFRHALAWYSKISTIARILGQIAQFITAKNIPSFDKQQNIMYGGNKTLCMVCTVFKSCTRCKYNLISTRLFAYPKKLDITFCWFVLCSCTSNRQHCCWTWESEP